MNLLPALVSAAGFEPATHALEGSPTQLQTTTCTSSLLHARHDKIKQIRTRHPSECPEGVRRWAHRDDPLPFLFTQIILSFVPKQGSRSWDYP